jgi:5,10-methylene-tetrahydrofolate dehydrogenase/Methenyl tetrahydrofolate cyclohydrolase
MSGNLIDGKAVAETIEREIREGVARLAARGIRPGLTAVRVGDDPASEIYVRNKAKKAEELGFRGVQKHFPGDTPEADLLHEIAALNSDHEVDGILVQLPLPAHISARKVIESIDPAKDVDGFHPTNVGRLHLGQKTLLPCTPAGCIRLIESTGFDIRGSHAVVVGRSDIVGKPVAALLLQRHATVTICHSLTPDLADVIRRGDIVVAAVGKPHLVQASMIRPGAVVIDVGINRIGTDDEAKRYLASDAAKMAAFEKRGSVIIGDVEFAAAKRVASWITPVPGGVGPMTIIMLMKNTLQAAEERRA